MSPTKLQATLQTALGHHRAGRLDQAGRLYDQVRKAAPTLFDPIHLAGTLAYQQGRYPESVALLTRALALDPRSAPCAMRLGLALHGLGKPQDAEKHLRASLARAPTADAWNALGLVLRALGRPADAVHAFSQAVAAQPGMAAAHDQLGALVADTQGFAFALPHFQRAVRLDPALAGGWCNLGLAQAQTGALADALLSLDRALALDPTLTLARMGKGLVHQKANRIDQALQAYRETLVHRPDRHEARSAFLLCLNYTNALSPSELFAEHRTFGTIVEAALPATSSASDSPSTGATAPRAGNRLRVAFLSPDLRAHSVAYFLEPLLQHLDRARFEIVLYHDHAVTDAVSARLREHASVWRNFASQPHAIVEAQIRTDAPDILIDLAGHTGFNRLPLFARRLAPVQICYLGYPNTSGLAAMDFKFTDARADPPGSSDREHTETLVRFAPTAWSYRPPETAPAVSPPPCLAAAPVTFGSFNNAAKFSAETLSLWTRVMARVPQSRLLLKGSGVEDPPFRAELEGRFRNAGIASDRLEFAGRTAGLEAHLDVYGRIDIALDTFPYHGTTTTCEALWMGRPVVTLAGDRHASRVGASLLHAAGHPEWIASTETEYVECAAALASAPASLAEISRSLRVQLSESPLLAHAAQAERFATALLECARQRGVSP